MDGVRQSFITTVMHLFVNDLADRANSAAMEDRDKSVVDIYIAQCNASLSLYTGAGIDRLIKRANEYYAKIDRKFRGDIINVLADGAVLSDMRHKLTHERRVNIARAFFRSMLTEMHRLAIDHAKTILHTKNRNDRRYLNEIWASLGTTFDLVKQKLQTKILTPGNDVVDVNRDEVDRLKQALMEAVMAQSKLEMELKAERKRADELDRALTKSMKMLNTQPKSSTKFAPAPSIVSSLTQPATVTDYDLDVALEDTIELSQSAHDDIASTRSARTAILADSYRQEPQPARDHVPELDEFQRDMSNIVDTWM